MTTQVAQFVAGSSQECTDYPASSRQQLIAERAPWASILFRRNDVHNAGAAPPIQNLCWREDHLSGCIEFCKVPPTPVTMMIGDEGSAS